MDRNIEKLCHYFAPGEIGHRIIFLEKTDSTNKYALDLPPEESEHGTVILTENQTAGRGRQGRKWFCSPGKGLFFTLILSEETFLGKSIPLSSLVAAKSLHAAIKGLDCNNTEIKWPNDILVNGKKVSGILGEMKTGSKGIEKIALGMSVNLGHSQADFPSELKDIASSVFLETGSPPKPKRHF
jgi:BirA family biotin operon repressor/biotin-[acetyl-CoA-carboxylase] ligase